MGAMIEKIWTGKTRRRSRAEKLLQKIWTRSADHHPGQRLLERPHSKRPERRTHSITNHDRSKATCTKGGNQRRTMVKRTVAAVRPRKPTNDAEAICEVSSRLRSNQTIRGIV